jgi:DNA-directed RNA polymerase specialized sigma24 family protein
MQAELVERASQGDGDAFASLAASIVDRCYALAYRILRDPDRAQDATQQALLGVWRDFATLRELDRFDAWLYRLPGHPRHPAWDQARGLSSRPHRGESPHEPVPEDSRPAIHATTQGGIPARRVPPSLGVGGRAQ